MSHKLTRLGEVMARSSVFAVCKDFVWLSGLGKFGSCRAQGFGSLS